jgi:transposase-like protein
MGLSRRMFTKEFKLAAVQHLEQGCCRQGIPTLT